MFGDYYLFYDPFLQDGAHQQPDGPFRKFIYARQAEEALLGLDKESGSVSKHVGGNDDRKTHRLFGFASG